MAESIDVMPFTYHKISEAEELQQSLQLDKNIQELQSLKLGDNVVK